MDASEYRPFKRTVNGPSAYTPPGRYTTKERNDNKVSMSSMKASSANAEYMKERDVLRGLLMFKEKRPVLTMRMMSLWQLLVIKDNLSGFKEKNTGKRKLDVYDDNEAVPVAKIIEEMVAFRKHVGVELFDNCIVPAFLRLSPIIRNPNSYNSVVVNLSNLGRHITSGKNSDALDILSAFCVKPAYGHFFYCPEKNGWVTVSDTYPDSRLQLTYTTETGFPNERNGRKTTTCSLKDPIIDIMINSYSSYLDIQEIRYESKTLISFRCFKDYLKLRNNPTEENVRSLAISLQKSVDDDDNNDFMFA